MSTLCFWYEAGPTGYDLFRQITSRDLVCHVVAPSLIPRKPGDRIKTDRRDAATLARLARAGELTAVWAPDEKQEALRDLTRCREDTVTAKRIAKQQLAAFLLRQGRRFDGGKKSWTQIHFRWLEKQAFVESAHEVVFHRYLSAVRDAEDRVKQLDKEIQSAAGQSNLSDYIDALCALKGVDRVTAATLAGELGDITRFDNPRQLMAFVGLVPSEHSSGQTRRQGRITKTGNKHVRRVLVEAAWCYRFAARKTEHYKRKAEGAPPAVQAIAWKAQQRLCGRYKYFVDKGKRTVQTCIAIARELLGFIWAIAQKVMGRARATGQAEPSSTL